MKLLKPFKCSQKSSLLLVLFLADLSKAASRDSSRIGSSCKTSFRFISQPFRSAFYYVASGADALASSTVSEMVFSEDTEERWRRIFKRDWDLPLMLHLFVTDFFTEVSLQLPNPLQRADFQNLIRSRVRTVTRLGTIGAYNPYDRTIYLDLSSTKLHPAVRLLLLSHEAGHGLHHIQSSKLFENLAVLNSPDVESFLPYLLTYHFTVPLLENQALGLSWEIFSRIPKHIRKKIVLEIKDLELKIEGEKSKKPKPEKVNTDSDRLIEVLSLTKQTLKLARLSKSDFLFEVYRGHGYDQTSIIRRNIKDVLDHPKRTLFYVTIYGLSELFF